MARTGRTVPGGRPGQHEQRVTTRQLDNRPNCIPQNCRLNSTVKTITIWRQTRTLVHKRTLQMDRADTSLLPRRGRLPVGVSRSGTGRCTPIRAHCSGTRPYGVTSNCQRCTPADSSQSNQGRDTREKVITQRRAPVKGCDRARTFLVCRHRHWPGMQAAHFELN